jgi:hypothetical protein
VAAPGGFAQTGTDAAPQAAAGALGAFGGLDGVEFHVVDSFK